MKKAFQSQLARSIPWIFLAIWASFNPSLWDFKGLSHQISSIGSFFGAASFIFFSISLFLITRWRKLEDWIGGLDKIFRYHQFLGKLGFSCLLVHVFTFALKWAPKGLASVFLYALPIHHRLSINLGSYAFLSITLILTITIFKLFPYHIWKKVHQSMGVFFLISFLHFFLSNKNSEGSLSTLILNFSALIGLVSVVYKQLLFTLFVKPFEYTVVGTETLSKTLMKVTLRAKNNIISFLPGQYAFIHFEEPNFPKEQHPFTLAKNDEQNDLLIFIKNRGEYTEALQSSIQSNWVAFLEGPYGRLDYRLYQKQVWIAGGIGIALFLSWVHSLKLNHEKTIDLFFCCHNRADLEAIKEFEKFKQNTSAIRIYTFCSEDGKRLFASEIVKVCPDYRDRKIFMCGPKRLTHDIRKQLLDLSVKKSNIEYEDFNFF